MWTGTTAVTGDFVFVWISFPVDASLWQSRSRYSRSFAGSMQYVRSSISTNAMRAPAWVIASVVAINVWDTVTTVSPCCTPAAINANRTASVPLAKPTQCLASQNLANSRSNSSTIGPPTNPALRKTFWQTARSSASSSTCGVIKSRKGIFSLLGISSVLDDVIVFYKKPLFVDVAQDSCRIAGYHRVGGHVFGDYAAGSDQSILADGDLG